MKRSAPTRLSSVGQLRRAAKLGDAASSAVQTVLKPMKALGFPYRKPTIPKGMVVPDDPSTLGANFDTDWARSTPAKAVRSVLTNGPMRVMVMALASPEIVGLDRLSDLERLDETPAVIFAPTITATSTRHSCTSRCPSRGAPTWSSLRQPTTSSTSG